jgi:hypothetical protein
VGDGREEKSLNGSELKDQSELLFRIAFLEHPGAVRARAEAPHGPIIARTLIEIHSSFPHSDIKGIIGVRRHFDS